MVHTIIITRIIIRFVAESLIPNGEIYRATVFSRTTTIHRGIFRVRALWADSVAPRTNTIASRDQFKPIRIGENLVANFKG